MAGAAVGAAGRALRLRFLVVDGYTSAARRELVEGGASEAGELYRRMLHRCVPEGAEAEVDVLHPADAGYAPPSAEELGAYDGVAWTGCSLTVHDTEDANVAAQLHLCRRVYEARTPSFGSCWALQVGTVAAGGVCEANPKGREQGFARKIVLSDAGRAHPMFQGKPAVFDAFSAHNDHVTALSPGATHLAGNGWSAVQAADIVAPTGARFWGVQYHPEYDLHELARLTYCRIPKLVRMGYFKDEAAGHEYVEQLEALHADSTRTDLAWLHGVDADTMDPAVREVEPRNWVRHLVIPEKMHAGAV